MNSHILGMILGPKTGLKNDEQTGGAREGNEEFLIVYRSSWRLALKALASFALLGGPCRRAGLAN